LYPFYNMGTGNVNSCPDNAIISEEYQQ